MARPETENDDGLMAPEASPGGEGSARPSMGGTRRVNNRPLILVAAVVVIFLLIVIAIIVDRANVSSAPQNEDVPHVGRSSLEMARRINGSVPGAGGEIEPGTKPGADGRLPGEMVEVPGPRPVPAGGTAQVPGVQDLPPIPPEGSNSFAAPIPPAVRAPSLSPEVQSRRERAAEIRSAKAQLFLDAVRSPTNIRSGQSRAQSAGSAGLANGDVAAQMAAVSQQMALNGKQDGAPSAADLAAVAALQAAIPEAPTANRSSGSRGTGQQPQANQFAGDGTGNRWGTAAKMEAPSTRFMLRAGFVIPGLLISGINSELPGQIVAQVSQNVYDTATGRYLLIPQGARLVGAYSSDVAFGQSRVLVAWQRIVFPDGKAMDIGAMPGADGLGYSGLRDRKNSHYLRTFTQALFLSGITAGVTLSQPQPTGDQTGRLSASGALSQALGQELGQTASQLIQKNLSVAPTLVIRPGFRFNVVVMKDLAFPRSYRPFDY